MTGIKKYVIQRADGKFWCKKNKPTKSYFENNLDRAYLFSTEKSAREHLTRPEMENVKVRAVSVWLDPEMDDGIIYVPSCWREEDIKRTPSMCSWASIGDDGEYRHGEKYYDADMNEITKEEYEALVGRPTD